MRLENNEDLYEFLLGVAKELKAHGETQLAREVILASRFASGSTSEFLHEAYQILTTIDRSRPAPLTNEQSRNLNDVLTQINEAFRKIGGA